MNTNGATPGDVDADIWFLAEKKLYETVKPYTLAFTPANGVPRENIERVERRARVLDIRGSGQDVTLEKNGFQVLHLEVGQFQGIDWDIDEDVEQHYYHRIADEVEKNFQGKRCITLGHRVRKRDKSFPTSSGQDYSFGQPLRAAHIDVVRSSAEQMILERAADHADTIFDQDYIVANIWRPLKGPNQDWPLALCDLEFIDPSRDLETTDFVTTTTSREHSLLYHRDGQRWWYMSHQEPGEALLFLQYCSGKGVASGVPHASFFNPHAVDSEPRESVEVTVVLW